ncbi:class I adenylate-forming enzyme family protein [Mycolicibacterium fluoranthenivorans]|uniref:Acyl-CoA synthetase (AMP-forming)/AMP-acid ligase II n=1 Tax=Mycolicibacterium fluoranthenivorans TaxID=258505 RepID=A0A7X5ZCK8_9MYCO|nr:class I adenylate-forming enzyme family protein [Mycolicibacterium fluoranthenivorans]MCV7356028.1 acyl--CoA ligase [Mycolicibacterium fluoranthenivorans]NIH95142.1 acyl-CoA synthetase (AMP-forming)/AMP-acid ligase II [Mycolicibacterium fluoranthenivorans]
MPSSLVELLRRRADHPLLVCDDERLGYVEADRRSAAVARGLVGMGAGKGTHIGLLYPNGADFVVGMLAAARIGAVVVPFSTFLTTAELRTQLIDSDVSILLTARSFRGHNYVERLDGVQTPCLRQVLFEPPTADEPDLTGLEADVDPCDPLAVIYTSGSTGPPRGAVHTHGALLAQQRHLNAIRGLTAMDRLYCNSPFFWIGGFAFGLLATITAGATLICSNTADAAATLDLLDAEAPTVTNGFVSGVTHLTRHPSYPTRRFTARRGNLYPIMASDVQPADPELRHNMLGMTEAGSVLLLDGDETDQPPHRRGSYGRPAPGFETRVLGSGELCIRGPFLMQHYHGHSREDCFDADGWFHTGDIVRIDDDGYVYFQGRAGSMIKTAGANVTPSEVEKALAALGLTAHVLGLPDRERGEVVAAVIVTDGDVDAGAIRTALRDTLSAFKIPRVVTTCRASRVPMLASGKVDLGGLRKLFTDV